MSEPDGDRPEGLAAGGGDPFPLMRARIPTTSRSSSAIVFRSATHSPSLVSRPDPIPSHLSPSPSPPGEGRGEGADFSGLFSVKQLVPSQRPSPVPPAVPSFRESVRTGQLSAVSRCLPKITAGLIRLD